MPSIRSQGGPEPGNVREQTSREGERARREGFIARSVPCQGEFHSASFNSGLVTEITLLTERRHEGPGGNLGGRVR